MESEETMTETYYQTIDNEYLNTGGNCMVDITTVYNRRYKMRQYVYINEEYLVVANYDYIRNELPDNASPEDYVMYEISQDAFTTDPSFDNRSVDEIDDDTALLLLSCLLSYIRNSVKHNRRNYFTTYDKLPNELAKLVTDSYRTWLDERSQLIETDGYKIIVDSHYHEPEVIDTPNGLAAKSLQEHLTESIKRLSSDDVNEQEKFYEEQLHIIYCGKLFTFANGADVFNGLEQFTEFVISEQ